MRIPCYFAHLLPQSRCSMWRFGWLTDKHAACPPGLAVVAGLDNELFVPDACGRVEIFDGGNHDATVRHLLEQGLHAGYRLRPRGSLLGGELPQPDTRVAPFVVRENSLLAANPQSPVFTLLAGPHRVYEGDDGEFYLQDPADLRPASPTRPKRVEGRNAASNQNPGDAVLDVDQPVENGGLGR